MKNSNQPYSVLVIGAGFSGLAIANLLQRDHGSVALVEQHYMPGGCASYFNHKGFRFDVGATTLSGLMRPYGPLAELEDALGMRFEDVRSLEKPMLIIKGYHRLLRHKNSDSWLKPFVDPLIVQWWQGIEKRAKTLWPLVSGLPVVHWRNSLELGRFALAHLGAVSHLFDLTTSVFDSLPRSVKANDDFISILEEQLLIATQSGVKQTSLAVGALALTYPDDMYYPRGGIGRLADDLLELFKARGGAYFPRHKVTDVHWSSHQKWRIQTSRQTFSSKKLVSTVPIWDQYRIQKDVRKFEGLRQQGWGAFVVYFGIRLLDWQPESLYVQLHWPKQPDWCHSGSVFLSFSDPLDLSRAPTGHVCLNLSSHVKVETFDLEKADYDRLKAKALEDCKILLAEYFKDIEIVFALAATPRTFEHYTQRSQGRVGGLPHTLLRPPVLFPSAIRPSKDIYQLGDTTYPGQGIMGVVSGAMKLSQYLGKTKSRREE
jgi:phytoene dehydrogenase-like protein